MRQRERAAVPPVNLLKKAAVKEEDGTGSSSSSTDAHQRQQQQQRRGRQEQEQQQRRRRRPRRKEEVQRVMAATWSTEVLAAEDRFEREISERKSRLDRAFRHLDALMERTERRMAAALSAISEIRRVKKLARHLEAETEEDSSRWGGDDSTTAHSRALTRYPPPFKLATPALPSPSSAVSSSRSRHQRSSSLEHLQRLLAERGMQLTAEIALRHGGRHSRALVPVTQPHPAAGGGGGQGQGKAAPAAAEEKWSKPAASAAAWISSRQKLYN